MECLYGREAGSQYPIRRGCDEGDIRCVPSEDTRARMNPSRSIEPLTLTDEPAIPAATDSCPPGSIERLDMVGRSQAASRWQIEVLSIPLLALQWLRGEERRGNETIWKSRSSGEPISTQRWFPFPSQNSIVGIFFLCDNREIVLDVPID